MEYFKLNNGVDMPMDGLGTFLLSPKEAEESVYSALKGGYSLIDTANAYMNERGVGRGIARSGVKREDIFLVTKLWPTEYEEGEKAIDDTLARLGTDYVDLLILHQPVGNYIAGYKAMEKAYKAGKVKALGLSNFPEERIRKVIDECEIVPQIVQVEAHPYYPQTALKKYLARYGMALMAWYPLGHGDKSLVQEPLFTREIVLRADGKNWDLGYPATAECADGSLLTVYYQALPQDINRSILYTKWRIEEFI